MKNSSTQPNRIFISSDDAESKQGGIDSTTYNTFSITLREQIIGCKGIQLASFIQPNVPADGACIPDYTASITGFLYYRSSSAGAGGMASATLQHKYLLASTNIIPNPTNGNTNRYFSSYTDFVSAMNNSISWIDGGNPDIILYYDSTNRRIYFQGTNPAYYYTPAGSQDPAVIAYIKTLSYYNPRPLGYTLNQRIGFTNPYYSLGQQQQGSATVSPTLAIYPQGYPNLVRTGSITIRTNFNNQSSINSQDKRDVLDVVPVQVPFLGVNEYQTTLNNFLTSVPDTLQQLTFSLFDEAGQPYPVDNSTTTAIELYVIYNNIDANQ